jgi:demethoxyubiquinone hydroxylase (CLK1/Coq7/Cat5 family)
LATLNLLRTRIARLRMEPAASSGVWGAFARALQAGADLLGDRAAIAVLEQGEERDLARHSSELGTTDSRTWKLIESELLPEQRRTRELCGALKKYADEPS